MYGHARVRRAAIGRDRPGIVAAISGALLELNGNVEDSQMSIIQTLRGDADRQAADPMDEAELEARLGRSPAGLGLEAIAVNQVDDLGDARAPHVSPSTVQIIRIVHTVSAALAGRGVNITGLETGSPAPTIAPLRDDHRGGRAGDLEPTWRRRSGWWRTIQRSR
jgi:glycine cleavage system transcriptional repressor